MRTQLNQGDKVKYLETIINRNGSSIEEIKNWIQQNKKIIRCLSLVWWGKNISNNIKKRLGCEVWTQKSRRNCWQYKWIISIEVLEYYG